jgi:hypothetical protein
MKRSEFVQSAVSSIIGKSEDYVTVKTIVGDDKRALVDLEAFGETVKPSEIDGGEIGEFNGKQYMVTFHGIDSSEGAVEVSLTKMYPNGKST